MTIDKNSKTIEAYNKNCTAYADRFMEFDAYIDRINEFAELLTPGMKIIDVGCGPGNVSRLLMRSMKSLFITGIDLSEEMIALAKNNVPEAEFCCQDIRRINFPEDSFDAAVLSFCIVHLSEAEVIELLKNISLCLKRGGLLYISFIEGDTEGFETTSFSKDKLYFYHYTIAKVQNLIKKSNFNITKITQQGYPKKTDTNCTEAFIIGKRN